MEDLRCSIGVRNVCHAEGVCLSFSFVPPCGLCLFLSNSQVEGPGPSLVRRPVRAEKPQTLHLSGRTLDVRLRLRAIDHTCVVKSLSLTAYGRKRELQAGKSESESVVCSRCRERLEVLIGRSMLGLINGESVTGFRGRCGGTKFTGEAALRFRVHNLFKTHHQDFLWSA